MDSFTHALAGSLLADILPFTRKLGRRAQIAAVAVAMSPDLDIIVPFIGNFPPKSFDFKGLFDMELMALYHRSYTHSFFFTFIASCLLAVLCKRWAGRIGPLWQWFALIWGAFISHILLDYTNPWGARFLLPFDDERFALSLMPFVDVIFSGLLLVGFVLNHVLRDPFREAGEPLSPPWREKSAGFLDRIAGIGTVGCVIWLLLFARVWLTVYGVFPLPYLQS